MLEGREKSIEFGQLSTLSIFKQLDRRKSLAKFLLQFYRSIRNFKSAYLIKIKTRFSLAIL